MTGLAIILGLLGANVAQATLLTNGGFEADGVGDSPPTGWTQVGLDAVKGVDLGITPIEGIRQFQLQNAAAGSLSQLVTIAAGGAYDLSMQIANRNNGNRLATVASGQVVLQLLDSALNVVAPDASVTEDYNAPLGTVAIV